MKKHKWTQRKARVSVFACRALGAPFPIPLFRCLFQVNRRRKIWLHTKENRSASFSLRPL